MASTQLALHVSATGSAHTRTSRVIIEHTHNGSDKGYLIVRRNDNTSVRLSNNTGYNIVRRHCDDLWPLCTKLTNDFARNRICRSIRLQDSQKHVGTGKNIGERVERLKRQEHEILETARRFFAFR